MAFHEKHRGGDGQDRHRGLDRQFRSQHDFDFYAAGFRTDLRVPQAAMNKAGSTDPAKFAAALEGPPIT
jgi:branched-chain amino acid transport system substrate-binding protein